MKKLFLILLLALAAFAAWEWISFPDVELLAAKNPETTAFMELRKAELRRAGRADQLDYRFVPYGRISSNLRRAVLVGEDDTFYEHEGVDVKGLKEALRKDWNKKRLVAGGSTITQQLAKNLYLSPSRNPFRKLKEYLIARSLEDHLSKKRILELYLNVAEFGDGIYGAEAAARHYFGKSAASLTPLEAATLAGSLPNPRVMNADHMTKRMKFRQRMILSRMRRWGYLAEQEVLTAKKPEAKPEETPEATDTDLTPEVVETATEGEPESTPAATSPEPAPSPSNTPTPQSTEPSPSVSPLATTTTT
ncbi:MAG: monofunctional biosynthetic peptidoglycan transglycosylase [Acidobacteriota bacterium]